MVEKIAYLGPEGSYSLLAAEKMGEGFTPVPYPNFRALFSAVGLGEVSCGVIPVENSINGAVVQNLDLMLEFKEISAKEECDVVIDHRLATLKGASLSDVKYIYSHAQALAQCAKYLNSNFPTAKLIPTSSTSESIKKITSPAVAGIIGAHMKAEGIELSPFNISDVPNNRTSFLKIIKGEPPQFEGKDKVFFAFTCRHKPGELVRILSVLSEAGVNMTKIQSRPIKDSDGEFVFIIEIETGGNQQSVYGALKAIKAEALYVRIFGAY